jgi:hypothetical protein
MEVIDSIALIIFAGSGILYLVLCLQLRTACPIRMTRWIWALWLLKGILGSGSLSSQSLRIVES